MNTYDHKSKSPDIVNPLTKLKASPFTIDALEYDFWTLCIDKELRIRKSTKASDWLEEFKEGDLRPC